MCNHYRSTIHLTGPLVVEDVDRVLGLDDDVWPDRSAPVIGRGADGALHWQAMRWGFPPAKPGGELLTNARDLAKPTWTKVLHQRCLVPIAAFAEPFGPRGKSRQIWFEPTVNTTCMFAGLWRTWSGARGPKKAPVEGDHTLFAFLTCEPNAMVGLIHPKAMPVVLATEEAQMRWLDPSSGAASFQAPALDGLLRIANPEALDGLLRIANPEALDS